jgi:spore coat protein U-like protein
MSGRHRARSSLTSFINYNLIVNKASTSVWNAKVQEGGLRIKSSN